MRATPVAIAVVSLMLASVNSMANIRVVISAATLEAGLRNYFERPCSKTAKPLLALIPFEGDVELSKDDAASRVCEQLDTYTSQLCTLIASKKVHAIRVGLALTRIPYDHHVQNLLAMSLANIAVSQPSLLMTQAQRLKMSQEEFAWLISCAGVCGYDDNAQEQLENRLGPLQRYCQHHSSFYCASAIDAILVTLADVKQSP